MSKEVQAMLLRHDPFSELERMADDLFGSRANGITPLDAFRRDDAVLVHVDLPGVDPDSIDVTVERNALTLRAERASDHQEGDRPFIRERPQGAVTRRIYLGEALDTENIDADYTLGVLTLRIPVAESSKPKRIEVRTREALESGVVDADSVEAN